MVNLYLSTFDKSVEKVRLYFFLTNKNFRTTNTSIKRRIEAVTAPTTGSSKLLQLSFDPSDNFSINERSRENKILVGFNELQLSSELGLSSQLSHVEE